MQAWPPDGDELARCAACRRHLGDAGRAPGHLKCSHRYCAACADSARHVYCVHCWRRAASIELPAALRTPRAPDLAARHRRTQLRALQAAAVLTQRLEAELAAPEPPSPPLASTDALVQSRLDDLVLTATVPLDFELIRRALAGPPPSEPAASGEHRDPLLLLANYCTTQLFTRQPSERYARALPAPSPTVETDTVSGGAAASEAALEAVYGESPASIPGMVRPRAHPLFYLELDVNGARFGRVVVALRWDAAPRMSRNFAALATRAAGTSYRGCSVFQCWPDESVIAGDIELNNGRGGRSALTEPHFAPDDSRLAAVRGALGMRREQRRRDSLGLVGSQFRIVLREMRGFTAIFGFVVEGLELVDRLSRAGDSAGKPHSTILISDCGKLD